MRYLALSLSVFGALGVSGATGQARRSRVGVGASSAATGFVALERVATLGRSERATGAVHAAESRTLCGG